MFKVFLCIFFFSFSLIAQEDFPTSFERYTHGPLKVSPIKEKDDYHVQQLHKTVYEGNQAVIFNYRYYSKKTQQKKLMLLFPTIRGVSYIERHMARYFLKNGYDVLIPMYQDLPIPFGQETVKYMNRDFLRFIVQVKFIVRDFSHETIHAFGASKGGIQMVGSLGHVPRISKAQAYVAGGNLPHVYAFSQVPDIEEFREFHMKALEMETQEEYEAYLSNHLIYDPEQYCQDRTAKLKLIVAPKDTHVPGKTQESLWNACGQPEKEIRGGGHHWNVISVLWHRASILEWFQSE